MSKSEEYERLAAKCLYLARDVRNPDSRARLVKMAEAWVELAERVRTKADQEKE